MKRLELRIFRFDKDKDYEAYYKPYVYDNYENFGALYDLLLQVQEDDIYFDFPKDESDHVLVNSQIFSLSTSLEQIIQEKGFELVIEPLSLKRATKDLIFDKKDFLAEFDFVAPLVSTQDRELYEKYDYLYYTSGILKFSEHCFGDSLFYFTWQMVQKYPERKLDLLKILADKDRGIFYHFPTNNGALERIIDALKDEIFKAGFVDASLLNFKQFQENEVKELENIKYDFKGFNIGLYDCKSDDLKTKLKAKFVDFKSPSSGFELLNFNANLAYKIAADIVLNAYDSGCDFLVVDKAKDFYMFDTCSKNLMKESGRDFEDFYILSSYELIALAQGEEIMSLRDHKLKVTLI